MYGIQTLSLPDPNAVYLTIEQNTFRWFDGYKCTAFEFIRHPQKFGSNWFSDFKKEQNTVLDEKYSIQKELGKKL